MGAFFMPKKKGGRRMARQLKFKSKKKLQEKIDEYFKLTEGKPYLDNEGNPVFNKFGRMCYIVDPFPPTVTGLALYLGMNSRKEQLQYQDMEEFNEIITRAKSRVEEYTEMRLFDREGSNGAKFSLTNNFKWENNPREPAEDIGAGMVALMQMLGKQAEDRDINKY